MNAIVCCVQVKILFFVMRAKDGYKEEVDGAL